MLQLSFMSSKRPEDILLGAEAFFVQQGLKTVEKNDTSIGFQSGQNGVGFVRVNVTHLGGVTVETVKWEQQVRQFAELYK